MKQMPDEVLDQLLEDCDTLEDILGANGLLANLQKSESWNAFWKRN